VILSYQKVRGKGPEVNAATCDLQDKNEAESTIEPRLFRLTIARPVRLRRARAGDDLIVEGEPGTGVIVVGSQC
jgi:hypothetical protein